MRIRIEKRKGILAYADAHEADSIEEAERICVALSRQGFCVFPRDENGVEYGMNTQGRLVPKPGS
jgi:hypothetical protein